MYAYAVLQEKISVSPRILFYPFFSLQLVEQTHLPCIPTILPAILAFFNQKWCVLGWFFHLLDALCFVTITKRSCITSSLFCYHNLRIMCIPTVLDEDFYHFDSLPVSHGSWGTGDFVWWVHNQFQLSMEEEARQEEMPESWAFTIDPSYTCALPASTNASASHSEDPDAFWEQRTWLWMVYLQDDIVCQSWHALWTKNRPKPLHVVELRRVIREICIGSFPPNTLSKVRHENRKKVSSLHQHSCTSVGIPALVSFVFDVWRRCLPPSPPVDE